MSRIHEALKKAEQERGASPPADAALTVEPGSGHGALPVPPAAVSSGSPPLIRGDGVETARSFLRLDDLRARCSKPTWKQDLDAIVFARGGRPNTAAERFRTLRSRLYRLREKQPVRRLLITSALPGEGKTFVAGNLAQAIARQHERRVLLIDADLRYSRLHLLLGAPSAPGLSDYLRGEADDFSIIQANPQDNLFFIPGGRPVSNPTELLADVRLKGLLDRLTAVFDWVILDSPPALPVSDAVVLATLCDGVLLVVQAGATAFDLAQKVCLEFQEKNLVGVVLNRAKQAAAYEVYSYYAGNGKDKR